MFLLIHAQSILCASLIHLIFGMNTVVWIPLVVARPYVVHLPPMKVGAAYPRSLSREHQAGHEDLLVKDDRSVSSP